MAKKVRFYGAIGSPGSAEVMGDLGVAPICLSTFPDKLLTRILERWRARAGAGTRDAILPISVKMFIADSDEEARALGRRYYPPYFDLQCTHYELDANPWADIPEYQDFSRMFANLRKLTDPAELGPFMDSTWWAARPPSAGASTSWRRWASTISWCRRPRPARRSSCASA